MQNLSDIDKHIKSNGIEFLDFGASKGGSIEFAKKYFCKKSGKGLGVDIDREKIDEMKRKGYDAFYGDVTKLELEEKVRFVIMSHFLEHLDGFPDSKKCLRMAAKNSTDFFYIQQPYFDADGYLFSKGLKFFWSHWGGHNNHMGTLEFYKILQGLLEEKMISRYAIYVFNRVESSADEKIQNISAPIDQHQYDEKIHPKKDNNIKFNEGTEVFQEVRVLAMVDPKTDFEELEKSFSWTKKIYDSSVGRIAEKTIRKKQSLWKIF